MVLSGASTQFPLPGWCSPTKVWLARQPAPHVFPAFSQTLVQLTREPTAKFALAPQTAATGPARHSCWSAPHRCVSPQAVQAAPPLPHAPRCLPTCTLHRCSIQSTTWRHTRTRRPRSEDPLHRSRRRTDRDTHRRRRTSPATRGVAPGMSATGARAIAAFVGLPRFARRRIGVGHAHLVEIDAEDGRACRHTDEKQDSEHGLAPPLHRRCLPRPGPPWKRMRTMARPT